MSGNGVLGHEESLRLIRAAQSGDEEAKETLIVRNTALVKSIVKKFLNRGVEFDDLMQIGSLGLVKAVLGYDPSYGVRFSTYAVPMIAGEIKRFLRDDGIIKVSRSLREKSFEIFSAKAKMKEELQREPTVEELAEKLSMTPEDVVFAMEAVRTPCFHLRARVRRRIEQDAADRHHVRTNDGDNDMIDKILLRELLQKIESQGAPAHHAAILQR